MLYDFSASEMRHVTLNFPLYQGVKSLAIGVNPDAVIEAPLPTAMTKSHHLRHLDHTGCLCVPAWNGLHEYIEPPHSSGICEFRIFRERLRGTGDGACD